MLDGDDDRRQRCARVEITASVEASGITIPCPSLLHFRDGVDRTLNFGRIQVYPASRCGMGRCCQQNQCGDDANECRPNACSHHSISRRSGFERRNVVDADEHTGLVRPHLVDGPSMQMVNPAVFSTTSVATGSRRLRCRRQNYCCDCQSPDRETAFGFGNRNTPRGLFRPSQSPVRCPRPRRSATSGSKWRC